MKETLSERKTGAIYIRVSTDKQEELSPDAQLRLLMDYAKNNHTDIPWNIFSKTTESQAGKQTNVLHFSR